MPGDEQRRIGRLLSELLLAIIVIIALDTALSVVVPETSPTVWLNGLVIAISLMLLWLVRRGHVRLSGMLLCLLTWPMTIIYIVSSGGIHSPALGLLSVFIAIGVTLFDVPGALGFGFLRIIVVGSLSLAEHYGWLTFTAGAPSGDGLC